MVFNQVLEAGGVGTAIIEDQAAGFCLGPLPQPTRLIILDLPIHELIPAQVGALALLACGVQLFATEGEGIFDGTLVKFDRSGEMVSDEREVYKQ